MKFQSAVRTARAAQPTHASSTLSPAAEKALHLGVEEAQRLKQQSVGSHHWLLGLVREREGAAARALASLGVTLVAARTQVRELARATA
jgi:ATP-dependent Clp protease ATP-binding subunit ClpC